MLDWSGGVFSSSCVSASWLVSLFEVVSVIDGSESCGVCVVSVSAWSTLAPSTRCT